MCGLTPQPSGATASVGKVDIVTKDADGNVITDTRAERLADARAFRDQCLRHAEDPLLKGLMASFRRAVADPADRMTHLYEIRDALSRHFGTEKEAKNALGLTNAEWSDLGRIANSEPIEESRHRGAHPALRPATEDEHRPGICCRPAHDPSLPRSSRSLINRRMIRFPTSAMLETQEVRIWSTISFPY